MVKNKEVNRKHEGKSDKVDDIVISSGAESQQVVLEMNTPVTGESENKDYKVEGVEFGNRKL